MPLVNVTKMKRLLGLGRKAAPAAAAGAWQCAACGQPPVVATRARCGHVYCHACSYVDRWLFNPNNNPSSDLEA